PVWHPPSFVRRQRLRVAVVARFRYECPNRRLFTNGQPVGTIAGDRVGESLAQILHESQLTLGNADHVARHQSVVSADLPFTHHGAVATVEVAKRPRSAAE